MTTALEATDKDFEQMMQMLTGFCVTQITGAVLPTRLRITWQRGLRLRNRLPKLKASIQARLSACYALVPHLDW